MLSAFVDYLLRHGLRDLSLRPAAATLGTSPRMLLYYFGSLANGFQSLASVNQPVGPPDALEWVSVATQAWACAESCKLDRATLGGMRPYPGAPFVARLPLSRDLFDRETLVRLGK